MKTVFILTLGVFLLGWSPHGLAVTTTDLRKAAQQAALTSLPGSMAVFEEALRNDRWSTAQRLEILCDYGLHLYFHGFPRRAETIVLEANTLQSTLLEDHETKLPAPRHGKWKLLQGRFLLSQGQFAEAIAHYLAISQASDPAMEKETIAQAWFSLGEAYYASGQYHAGYEAFGKAANFYHLLGDRRMMAYAMMSAGTTGTLRPLGETMQETLDVLEIFRAEKDKVGMARAYHEMGYDSHHTDESSLQCFANAILLAGECGDVDGQLAAISGMAEKLTDIGRYQDAQAKITEGRAILHQVEEVGSVVHFQRVSGYIGLFSTDVAQLAEARRLMDEVETYYQKVGRMDLVRAVTQNYAEAYEATGRFPEALPYALRFVEWARERERNIYPRALRLKSRIEEGLGDFPAALATARLHAEVLQEERKSGEAERLEQMKLQYESALKEHKITLLEKENEIQALRIRDQQNENLLLRERHAHDQTLSRIAQAAGMVAFVLSLIFWALYRDKRNLAVREKALNDLLRQEKRQVERQTQLLAETNLDLQKTNARLKEIDEQRRSLLGLTIHDMKNPLGGVMISLGIIEDEWKSTAGHDPEITSLIATCRQSMDYMSHLIETILKAQENDHAMAQVSCRPVDPRPLLQQTIELNQSAARKKSIRLNLLPHHAEQEIQTDPICFREVVDNLVSNAVKYSHPDSEVTISLEANQDHLTISILDGGPGLQPEDMPRLFQPFSKLSARPTAGESSTGLGLYSVKQLTEAMGGSVSARNHPQGGAVFTISFPLAGKKTPSTTSLPVEAASPA